VTLTVEDDFREFVVARWPDLGGVAFVVTLDAASARRVTTQAFATLHRQWREALDEGRPGWRVRRSVLVAAIAATPTVPPTVPPTTPSGEPDDDPVRTALEVVVRAATPLERALVGAGSVWAAGPDEVADLLGMPVADVRALAASLRGRLVAAHDAARAAEGLPPAEWTLDGDLEAVVERLLGGQGDPLDPTALVEERRRSLRRRSLVAGGAAVLAVGAASWWSLRGEATTAVARSSAGAAPTGPPPPDDPSWQSVSRWAARGRLVTDSRVQGLVVSRTSGVSRLLFADDVAGRRVVVAGTLNPGTEDLVLQTWHGPEGADPAALDEVRFSSSYVGGAQDAMVLALPTSPGTLLLVLARPPVTEAAYSPTVVATVAGTVRRDWLDVPLRAGIGTSPWPAEAGPALRGRCSVFDGPVLGTAQTWVGQGGRDGMAGFTAETNRFVAAALGRPEHTVRTEVVTDATVGGSVIDPRATSPRGGDGRVRVLRTTTAEGAVVRSVRVVDDGRSRVNWLDLEQPTLLPADTRRDEPVVGRLDDARADVGRYLVVAPGAARVQLLATSPSAYPVSKVTRTRGGVAVVEVVNADDAATFRLVRRDSRGTLLGDEVPRPGVELLNLWDEFAGDVEVP